MTGPDAQVVASSPPTSAEALAICIEELMQCIVDSKEHDHIYLAQSVGALLDDWSETLHDIIRNKEFTRGRKTSA